MSGQHGWVKSWQKKLVSTPLLTKLLALEILQCYSTVLVRPPLITSQSLRLLIHNTSIVAVVAGTVLPYLNQLDQRLLAPDVPVDPDLDSDAEEDLELIYVRELVRQWKAEAAREGRPLKLPTMPFMLRNIWTASLALFAAVMLATFWIKTVWAATIAISLLGISWACAVWVPFAIIMQVRLSGNRGIREEQDR